MKVEGRNSVYELLKTDKEIDKILVQKDLKDDASKRLINIIRSHKIKLQPVDKYVIEKESESKRHQGFIAYVSDYKYFDIDDILNDCKEKDGLIVTCGVTGKQNSRGIRIEQYKVPVAYQSKLFDKI